MNSKKQGHEHEPEHHRIAGGQKRLGKLGCPRYRSGEALSYPLVAPKGSALTQLRWGPLPARNIIVTKSLRLRLEMTERDQRQELNPVLLGKRSRNESVAVDRSTKPSPCCVGNLGPRGSL
jgi:hypothetical protein